MKAADQLATENINCAIMDPFTIKPLDVKTLVDQAKRVGGRIITVEDHYPEGELND